MSPDTVRPRYGCFCRLTATTSPYDALRNPANWLDKAKNRTTQLENLSRHFVSLVGGDLASNRGRVIRLFAVRTRFTHFYAVFNCILQPTGKQLAMSYPVWLWTKSVFLRYKSRSLCDGRTTATIEAACNHPVI